MSFLARPLFGAALLLAAVCGGACSPAARQPAAAENSVGPEVASPISPSSSIVPMSDKPDGPSAVLHFTGKEPVTVQPVALADEPAKCAVLLTAGTNPVQRVMTIGEGETEALTCGHVLAFGRVPAPAGTDRIALLYDSYGGPNAEVLQPVILERSAGQNRWAFNDALAQSIGEDGSLTTIPAIRTYLTRTKR